MRQTWSAWLNTTLFNAGKYDYDVLPRITFNSINHSLVKILDHWIDSLLQWAIHCISCICIWDTQRNCSEYQAHPDLVKFQSSYQFLQHWLQMISGQRLQTFVEFCEQSEYWNAASHVNTISDQTCLSTSACTTIWTSGQWPVRHLQGQGGANRFGQRWSIVHGWAGSHKQGGLSRHTEGGCWTTSSRDVLLQLEKQTMAYVKLREPHPNCMYLIWGDARRVLHENNTSRETPKTVATPRKKTIKKGLNFSQGFMASSSLACSGLAPSW